MKKDTLFRQNAKITTFTFNQKVAEVFDDMACRSVPLYTTVIDGIIRLIECLEEPRLTVYDLGCATGTTLLEIARRVQRPGLRLIGIDNAEPMLEKARKKAAMYKDINDITFLNRDIATCSLDGADVVLCTYTLQFIAPKWRQAIVDRIYRALAGGGMFILSEKVIAPERLQSKFTEIYHEFKRRQGYSELEIAAKREALENVLIPFSTEKNMTMLHAAGFDEVDIFCRWFNFSSFVALKHAHHRPRSS